MYYINQNILKESFVIYNILISTWIRLLLVENICD